MKRKLAGLTIVLQLAVGTAGCAGDVPKACPALAWFNSVTVMLDGSAERVSLVELCAEGVCSVRSDGPARFPETSVSPGAVPAPATTLPVTSALAPSVPPISDFTASRVDDRTWKVSLLMRTPTTVTIKVYSTDGTVLAQREVELDWTRVGGSEACGGRATAGPVRLAIPRSDGRALVSTGNWSRPGTGLDRELHSFHASASGGFLFKVAKSVLR